MNVIQKIEKVENFFKIKNISNEEINEKGDSRPFHRSLSNINTSGPRKNDRHFPDIFKCIFLN